MSNAREYLLNKIKTFSIWTPRGKAIYCDMLSDDNIINVTTTIIKEDNKITVIDRSVRWKEKIRKPKNDEFKDLT